MVFIPSLWLPILLSAVARLRGELHHPHAARLSPAATSAGCPPKTTVREALGPFDVPPGEYVIPHAGECGGDEVGGVHWRRPRTGAGRAS